MNKLSPMWSFSRIMWPVILLALLLPAAPAVAVDTATVTANVISARLKEVETSTSLDEETKKSLVEILNNALGNLETTRSNKATTEAYTQAVKTAPKEALKIHQQLDSDIKDAKEVTVTSTKASPFNDIERELLQEKANLAAVSTKLDDFQARLESATARPTILQKKLLAANQKKDDLESQLKLPPAEGELSWLTEARRWAQTTRVADLRSETSMLDHELLSLPMRVELLEAQRDEAAHSVERITARVRILNELSTQKGSAEAEQAEAAAKAAVSDAAGKHQLIQELAEQNAELTRETSTLADELSEINERSGATAKEAKRIEESFRSAREKLGVAGLSEVLGEVLRHERQTLPDQRRLGRRVSELEKTGAQSALRQIQYTEKYKKLRKVYNYVSERTADLEPAEAARISPDIYELASARRLLLEKAIDLNKSYSRSLAEYAAGSRNLLKVSVDYDNFLAEKLLWIRSAPAPNLEALQAIPGQVATLLSPVRWYDVFQTLAVQLTRSPLFVLLLGLAGVLLWKGQHMLVLLRDTGKQMGKPSLDKFSFTLKALGLTLLLAVPLPLLLAILGWELGADAEATQFTRAVSVALLQVAPTFLYLQFFSTLCIRGGVAEKHFTWHDPIPRRLRRGFRRLMVVFLPAVFVLVLLVEDDKQVLLAGLERILMVVALGVVALFFQRALKLLIRYSIGSTMRLRFLWYALTVVVPLVLAVLAVFGYIYTAGVLGSSLVQTLWFVFGLVVLHQVVVRWLLLVQRRLALQAVRERMRAAREEKAPVDSEMEGISDQLDEPEIDLVAMSEESRKLLNTLLVIIGIVGFWHIWSDVLPALNILNAVTLWHQTVMVAGEETIAPVTLANIGIAILIVIVTYVAMKRLPALLEIVLLQRVSMNAGARYTATTLTTYVIVGIGLLSFFRVIGADWSKLQWLFAALSVGIGFGLQEIVANFISGLIILFERPIRVGDVVTIGTTDGVVTRIQIRATTIRTWDRQELLVPNKEFITGRLLNWSLSDQVTRVKVPVGVAYGSDVQLAMSLMSEAGRENENVLAEPKPSIIFDAFGDNSLNLVLRCFVGTQDVRMTTVTQLHEAVNSKFNAAGICIAFPQRDVHLDASKPLEVRISRDKGTGETS
jgi:potassium efflux system protein